ncbi:hypothetical protein M422DRAFT_22720 [Sphaerobolus stellatus SS14]|nr:hypothetical protein M422DRAFT_22720 [Sphaerobolus stellatus SS14]
MLEASKQEVPDRSTSVSPRMRLNTLRDVSMNAAQPARPRPRKVMHIHVDATPDVPISSFARRHTPQSSPTAPTFHHQRKRSDSFSPVLLPTLLPGLSSPHYANEAHTLPSEVEILSHPEPSFQRSRRPHGLKISSYRVVSPTHNNGISVQSVL